MFAPAAAAVGDWQGALLAPASLRALRAGLACIGGSAVAVAGTAVTAVGAASVSAGVAGNAGTARAPCALTGGMALAAFGAGGTVMSVAVSVAISAPSGARALSAESAALRNPAVGATVLALSKMTNATASGDSPFSSQMVAVLSEVAATGASVQPLVLVGTDASTYTVSLGDVAALEAAAAAAAAATATASPPAAAATASSANVAAIAGGAAAAAALAGAAVAIAGAVVLARRRRASRSKLTGVKPALVTGDAGGDADADFALKSPMKQQPGNSAAAPSFRAVDVHGTAKPAAKQATADGAKPEAKQAAADGASVNARAVAEATLPGLSAAPAAAAATPAAAAAAPAAAAAAPAAAAAGGAAVAPDEVPLPAGWEEAYSARRQAAYYRNIADGSTVWERPTLPAGWSSEDDGQGNTYYVNNLSSAKQWEVPTAAATADAAPVAADGGLPAGWTAAVDEASGATYYTPDDGSEAVWELPTAPTAGHGSG